MTHARIFDVVGLLVAIGLSALTVLPVGAQGSPAPTNLACKGKLIEPSPGPGYTLVLEWEWTEIARVDSPIGSSDGPYAVAVDAQCNSYLTDSEHFQIRKMSPEGKELARWPMPGQRNPGESSGPRGIAVDAKGFIYVTDTSRDRVYKLSPDGKVVGPPFGNCSGGGEACDPKLPGRFIGPEGIAVGGDGTLFVAEVAGERIQKMSPDGKWTVWNLKGKGIGDAFIPGSLALDQAGFLYMTDAYNDWVLKFDPKDGSIVGRWGGTRGGEPGQFHGPLGVGVDAAGNIYVSDSGNWRVQKLDAQGNFLDQWRNCLDGDPPCGFPDAGSDPGQFFVSRGIALDQQGTIYVADTANKRLQRLWVKDYHWQAPPPPPDEG